MNAGRVRRRVLIVVSSYAPTMIADMQRARMLAKELPSQDWDVEILAPGSEFQHPSCLDSDSEAFFPQDIPIHSVAERFSVIFRFLNMRSIGWRAFLPLLACGRTLLISGRFDLVFFSTTQFCLFLLGPIWNKQTGVPYVLDFHDPCYRDRRGVLLTTKQGLKSFLSEKLAKFVEFCSVRSAASVVAVSPNYVDSLQSRYKAYASTWKMFKRNSVIPFGALESEISEVQRTLPAMRTCATETLRLVYVGAGGPVMARSFTLMCRSLAILRKANDPLVSRSRVLLYGTVYGWQDGGIKDLQKIANEQGVGDLVEEFPQRVTYRQSLELLLTADGGLVFGVDDEGYMPSKLFVYGLSGKPLLAVLHVKSPAYEIVKRNPEIGHCLGFGGKGRENLEEAAATVSVFLKEAANRQVFNRAEVLKAFLAGTMAKRHAALFEECLQAIN